MNHSRVRAWTGWGGIFIFVAPLSTRRKFFHNRINKKDLTNKFKDVYFWYEHKYSKVIREQAEAAWKSAFQHPFNDPTHGATHWENINAFGKPRWAKNMLETLRYKDHVFYKEIGE